MVGAYGALVGDTDTGIPKFQEKSQTRCHLFYQKSGTIWPRIESGTTK